MTAVFNFEKSREALLSAIEGRIQTCPRNVFSFLYTEPIGFMHELEDLLEKSRDHDLVKSVQIDWVRQKPQEYLLEKGPYSEHSLYVTEYRITVRLMGIVDL